MEILLRDLKLTVRMLAKATGFTTVVVLTLALGIGANTAIFSLVHAVLFRPLPYSDPSRLVMFWESFRELGPNWAPITEGSFTDYAERNSVFSTMSGFRIRSTDNNRPITFTGNSVPEAVDGILCTANLFDTLGVLPSKGRSFVAEDGEPGALPVVIVSHGFWERRLGADDGAVGKSIQLDGVSREIVGVLPPDFFFPPPLRLMGAVRETAGDIFIPYAVDPDSRRVRVMRSVARLRDGLTFEQATAALKPLSDQLAKEHPENNPKELRAVLLPLHEQAVEHTRSILLVLLSAVGLILLIGCVNVANLFMARTLGRRREMAIRIALGGRRWDIARQMLIESLFLALLGGLAGVALATVFLKAVVAVSAAHIPRLGPVTLDTPVLVFTFLVSLATGLLFGLAPTLQATQPNLNEDLKEGERGNVAGGRQFFRQVLVVCEVALAVILLIGAGLLLKSLWRIQDAPLGFDPEKVLAITALPPETRYPRAEQFVPFFERLIEELQTLPGVEQVGAVSQLPLSGGLFGGNFDIIGKPSTDQSEKAARNAAYRVISQGYLETMGISVLQGRSFNEGDRADTRPVVLIDRSVASRFWPDGSWVSALIRVTDSGPELAIVGLVENICNDDLRAEYQGVIYFPLRQFPNRGMNIVARTALEPEQLEEEARERLRKIDPDVALDVQSLQSYVVRAQSDVRAPTILFAFFAGLALTLATVGLYGVMSFIVGQRQREIGIRMALGARRSDILRKFGSETTLIVVLGIVLGVGGSVVLSRLLAGLLYNVAPVDPGTYFGVAGLFLLVALVSGYWPARRASRVDPIDALRTE